MALQAQAELASGLDAGADVGSDHGHPDGVEFDGIG
jgi:hypothetical protein